MPPIPGILADVGTTSIGTALGFGLGLSLGTALEAEATGLQQDSFNANPLKALSAGEAARIVAQAIQQAEWGHGEAASSGINTTRFNNMVAAELRGPAVGELLQFIRRSIGGDADIEAGLRKAQLDPRWDDMIKQLAIAPLEPAEIAKAIHRGTIAAQGLLVAVPPTTPGKVPIVPQSTIDATVEAEWSGIDAERLRVLVGNAGLPPGPIEMLNLFNRGEITKDDFLRGVGESNMRNEWGQAMFALRRRLLTPHEYEEAALRGIITNGEADAGAALAGMEPADAQLLFEIMGRPLAVHQITTGLARGGTYGGTYDDVPEPYRDAIRRSNIRPEYAVLAHANRYTYPSAFVLRALAQAGEFTEAETTQILLDIGWPPDIVAKVAPLWTGGAGAAVDPLVKKAETQVWSALHKAYVDDNTTDAQATADLKKIGATDVGVTGVLALWQVERAIVRRSLTPSQIKKAIGQPGRDDAWASARLLELGYTADDAATFLAE